MGRLMDIWDKSKDGNRKEQRSFLRYFIISTSIFVILVGFGLFNHDNIIAWVRAGLTIRRPERQMEIYQKEIDKMDAKVKMLSNDKDSLERYARENFNFAEPGDDVYIVDK